MNIYKVKVILDVVAKDDQTAIENVREDILEDSTEIDNISIISHEIYS